MINSPVLTRGHSHAIPAAQFVYEPIEPHRFKLIVDDGPARLCWFNDPVSDGFLDTGGVHGFDIRPGPRRLENHPSGLPELGVVNTYFRDDAGQVVGGMFGFFRRFQWTSPGDDGIPVLKVWERLA